MVMSGELMGLLRVNGGARRVDGDAGRVDSEVTKKKCGVRTARVILSWATIISKAGGGIEKRLCCLERFQRWLERLMLLWLVLEEEVCNIQSVLAKQGTVG